jgi:hypothetical protein
MPVFITTAYEEHHHLHPSGTSTDFTALGGTFEKFPQEK